MFWLLVCPVELSCCPEPNVLFSQILRTTFTLKYSASCILAKTRFTTVVLKQLQNCDVELTSFVPALCLSLDYFPNEAKCSLQPRPSASCSPTGDARCSPWSKHLFLHSCWRMKWEKLFCKRSLRWDSALPADPDFTNKSHKILKAKISLHNTVNFLCRLFSRHDLMLSFICGVESFKHN